MILWYSVGSDGTTAKAGQILLAGQDPQPIVRSTRHAIMLKWHGMIDGLLGNMRTVDGAMVIGDFRTDI
jgi:hypothetical protein